MKSFFHSLKSRILLTMFLVLVPMSMIMYIMNVYSIKQIQKNLYENNHSSLKQDIENMDESLLHISTWLSLQAIGSELNSGYISTVDNYQEREVAKAQMLKLLHSNIAGLTLADGIACYAPANKNLIYVYQSGKNDFQIWSGVKERIIDNIDMLLTGNKWTTWQINGKPVLIDIAGFNGIYYISWTTYDSLLNKTYHNEQSGRNMIVFGEEGTIYYSTMSDTEINSLGSLSDVLLTFEDYFYIGKNRNYLATSVSSQMADFSLMKIVDRKDILGIFYRFPILIGSATFFLLLIGSILIFRSLNYRVFWPIKNMEKGMHLIEAGNLDIRIENHHSSTEISHLIDSFNEMTGQIQNLKIQVYEEKLEHKTLEMDYLQLQLEPHFYLNALNLISMMAQVGDTELIQELTGNLSEYLRYIVSARKETVTLYQELEHVRHYLKIMEIRLGEENFVFECDADEWLLETQVLPLTLQTIVENSLKYAFSFEYKTRIELMIKEKNDILLISVLDNGPGYPEEILKCFAENRSPEGRHIGLWNLKLRQEYFYKEENVFHICNRPPNGACTEIVVPIRRDKTEAKL